MRHEEAGAFAAQAEALLMDRLTAMAGSCGPGSLHFINGLYEANRNRAPVISHREPSGAKRAWIQFSFRKWISKRSIGLQRILRNDLRPPDQALRRRLWRVRPRSPSGGWQFSLSPSTSRIRMRRAKPPFRVHVNKPVIRPSDEDLDRIADMLAEGTNITIYAGSGCVDAHDESSSLPSGSKRRSRIPRAARTRSNTTIRTMWA